MFYGISLAGDHRRAPGHTDAKYCEENAIFLAQPVFMCAQICILNTAIFIQYIYYNIVCVLCVCFVQRVVLLLETRVAE